MPLPAGPAIPAAVQALNWVFRPVQFMDECARRYGDLFTMRLPGLGPMVMVSNPEGLKQVYTASAATLLSGAGNEILRPALGSNSVFLLDGARHARERK